MSLPAADPLISVVIPTYNYGHLLPRALDSVMTQLAADVEVVVVDDGSTDDTLALLAAYQCRTGQRLQVITQPNGGAAAARNRGVRAARGRYVLLLDADDTLLPTGLHTLRHALLAEPDAGMVLGAYLSVNAAGIERLRLPTAVTGDSTERVRRYLLDKKIAVSHSRALFRRELLLQRPYPEQLRTGEDIAVFAYVLATATVVTTATPVAKIYKHADSLRHRRGDETFMTDHLVTEVFASLPAACQQFRQRYQAKRYLSLFRAAALYGDRAAAAAFYRHALRLSPGQALRFCYLNSWLRVNLGWR
jgi:glycosyltransferase involved in cell wall biosynthesis